MSLFFSPVEIFKHLHSAISLLALSPNLAVPIDVISRPPASLSNLFIKMCSRKCQNLITLAGPTSTSLSPQGQPCFPAADEWGQDGHRAHQEGWEALAGRICVYSFHSHHLGFVAPGPKELRVVCPADPAAQIPDSFLCPYPCLASRSARVGSRSLAADMSSLPGQGSGTCGYLSSRSRGTEIHRLRTS